MRKVGRPERQSSSLAARVEWRRAPEAESPGLHQPRLEERVEKDTAHRGVARIATSLVMLVGCCYCYGFVGAQLKWGARVAFE